MDGKPSKRPLLLGHRGARAVRSIPENSIASIDRALADGCDGVEFDVRLTADGEAVLCHDPETAGLKISDASAIEVPDLARLPEVLARFQTSAFLDIELKVSGVEKIILDLLERFPPHRKFVISSFDPDLLRRLRTENSFVPLGLICETTAELSHWRQAPIEYLILHHELIERIPSLLSDIKAAQKKSMVWTVNSAAEMKRFSDLEVDGIISDETALLCKTLKGRS